MRIRMYGQTDIGLVRSVNQDSFFCDADYGIAIVSDGMGGHKGGEIASQMVVEGLKNAFFASQEILVEQVGPFLDDVLRKINGSLLKHAKEDPRLEGMGATVDYLQVGGGQVAIGHAGDSRTYLVRAYLKEISRGGTTEVAPRYGFWQLTIDHNVETFVERGLLIPGRDLPLGPLSSRQKSRLVRGMGVMLDLKSDLYRKKIQADDVYLTCSDGLHGYVSERDILQTLVSGPIAEAPQRLIALAKTAGAPDNVTVVITVCSDKPEPLQMPEPTILKEHPFLVRTSSGELLGPMSAEKVISRWLSNDLPGGAEVSANLCPWRFLNQPHPLFKTYPSFNTERVRGHLRLIVDEPVESRKSIFRRDKIKKISRAKTDSKKPFPKSVIFLALIVVISILFILIGKVLSL